MGSDINKPNLVGHTPLFIACVEANSTKIATILIENGANINPEYNILQCLPIKNKVTKMLKLLVKKGANINVIVDYNSTLLHEACRGDFRDVVTFLIENGADHTIQDEDGHTPLDLAENESFREYVQGLIDCRDAIKGARDD